MILLSKVLYNVGQIQREMELIAVKLFQNVSEKILMDFQGYVKGVYKKKPTVYSNPGTKMFEAWEWDEIKRNATEISRKMVYNPDLLQSKSVVPSFNDNPASRYSDFGIHGSKHWDGTEDVRDIMPDIMNSEPGEAYWSTHPMTYQRPYKFWDKFIQDYVNGGKLKNVIDKEARNLGLTIT